MSVLQFYPLTVASVVDETDDAVSITFAVPDELGSVFTYLPGQHVTLRADIGGEDVRRSYSICANANTRKLRVGIKRLEGGAFSNWALDEVVEGTTIDVMPPVGEFTIRPSPDTKRHYCGVAAGSGITPLMSLISTTLESEPLSRWTLLLGNRAAGTVMFLEELSGLKDRYPDRFHIVHVLSREAPEVPLLAGRLDEERLRMLFERLVPVGSVDEWFLCGPYEMVMAARSVLSELGVEGEAIRDELFFAGPAPAVAEVATEGGSVELVVTLDGRRTITTMEPEVAVLDAAMAARTGLPYSCKGGMCASCKAHLVEGEVRMDRNWALVDADLDAGYILTCQSHPVSDRLVVDYDRR